MRINAIKPYTTNFKSCSREYTVNSGLCQKTTVHTTTYPSREIEELYNFAFHITNDFRDKNKVNVCSLACSDGTEMYTIAIFILDSLFDKREAQKYFPIVGHDMDKEVIKAAKSGRLNLGQEKMSNEYFYNLFWSYFEDKGVKLFIKDDKDFGENVYSYAPTRELKNKLCFREQDMLSVVENLQDDSNTGIICRNVIPYLTKPYQTQLYNTLKDKLHKNSLILTADFDNFTHFSDLLDNGIKGIESPAFKKISKHIYARI